MASSASKDSWYQEAAAAQIKAERLDREEKEAARKVLKDWIEDFPVFRRMSPHMRSALKSRGIDDFKTAMKFVEGMKETTGLPDYSLNDLIIYTCLLDKVVFDD